MLMGCIGPPGHIGLPLGGGPLGPIGGPYCGEFIGPDILLFGGGPILCIPIPGCPGLDPSPMLFGIRGCPGTPPGGP